MHSPRTDDTHMFALTFDFSRIQPPICIIYQSIDWSSTFN